jgi:hypothetical protein
VAALGNSKMVRDALEKLSVADKTSLLTDVLDATKTYKVRSSIISCQFTIMLVVNKTFGSFHFELQYTA